MTASAFLRSMLRKWMVLCSNRAFATYAHMLQCTLRKRLSAAGQIDFERPLQFAFTGLSWPDSAPRLGTLAGPEPTFGNTTPKLPFIRYPLPDSPKTCCLSARSLSSIEL